MKTVNILTIICLSVVILGGGYYLYTLSPAQEGSPEVNDRFYTSPDVVFGDGLGSTEPNVEIVEGLADPVPKNSNYADIFYPEDYQYEY